MPQLIPTSIVREVTTTQGEVAVKIELTLNLNVVGGELQVQANAKPVVAPEQRTPGIKKMPEIEFEIPVFESGGEMMNFGKEVK